jgi:hypothetical protein
MDIGQGISFGGGVSVTKQPPNIRAIFGYGNSSSGYVSITNLVSNTGVVGNDVTGVGSVRDTLAAASYGGDKAIFGYGSSTIGPPFRTSITNLLSNT